MAINQDIINASWEGQPKSSIEAGLKALLQRMLEVLEGPLAANSVGSDQLTQALRDAINSIGSKVPNTRTVNGKELSSNITIGPDDIMVGNQTLADKLDDMDDAIGQGGDTSGLATRIAALESALDRLTGTNDSTQVIDTFNEVIDFLNNVYNDETLIGKLQQLQNQINSKANDNAVVKDINDSNGNTLPKSNGIVTLPPAGSTISPATASPSMDGTASVGSSEKYAREDHVHPHDTSKQDTLTYDDVPTAGSNNPVKSGGIKTAIDQVTPTIDANGKWVIGGVATDKDAQGPRGNTVLVNENAVGIQALIVNNVSDGGETDILSAEMGKVIRQNIMRIFNALGTYAFHDGKPILNWGSTVINHSINVNGVTGGLTISDVEVDGTSAVSLPAQIADGKSLSLALNLPSNLHVFDDGVTIMMGGVNITTQQGVWDESTGEINIASVVGDVVITATALTYVGYGEQNSPLVLMLDGKNQGSTAGQWANLCDANKPLVLSGGYTKGTDHVEFDGTDGFGLIDGYNEALPFESTSVESVLSFDSLTNVVNKAMLVMANCKNQSIALQFTSSGNVMGATQAEGATAPIAAMGTLANAFAANEKVRVVEYGNDFMLNNTAVDKSGTDKFIIVPNNTSAYSQGYGDLCVSGYYTRAGAYMYPLDGKIFAIRIYSKKLSVDELTQNWKVDKKRFNIS